MKKGKKNNLLTREEFGLAVYEAIKADLVSRGYSMTPKNFDPNYPLAISHIYNIRNGQFRVETLNQLPSFAFFNGKGTCCVTGAFAIFTPQFCIITLASTK